MKATIEPTAAEAAPSPVQYSPEEWELRVQLAACYRLAAHFGITDFFYTHITARVPGPEHHFLINPMGPFFHEITASSLVKIGLDGHIVEATSDRVNTAGFIIHSAIHRTREDVACVFHAHTFAGAAVSAQKGGLLPISQYALQFYNRVAYHEYEGLAFDPAECERLAGDLGDKRTMIMRNHGLLTAGRNVPEAFMLMVNLVKACEVQIKAQAGGELHVPPPEICEHTAQQFENMYGREEAHEWPAALHLIEDQRDDYAR